MRGHWKIVWSHAGLWILRELPWRDAARVDAALLRFANTGEGSISVVASDPTEIRLKIPGYVVRLSADPFARILTVWWILRA